MTAHAKQASCRVWPVLVFSGLWVQLCFVAPGTASAGTAPSRASGASGSGEGLATRTVLSGLWVEGVRLETLRQGTGAEGIRLGADEALRIEVTCEPPRPDALFSYRVEGLADWSRGFSDSTFRIRGLSPGTRRILIASRSSGALWSGDTLSLALQVTPETAADPKGERAASEDAPSSGGFLGLSRIVWIVGGAVLVGLIAALYVLRQTPSRYGSVPDGALLVVDATAPEAKRAPRRSGPGTSGGPPDRGFAADRGKVQANGRNGEGATRVPSRRRTPGQDTSQEARARMEEMERELRRLRKRIQELLGGARTLKRTNRDLHEKCGFLEQSNRTLRELQQRKEEILAGLVHDIKNPAGAIRNLAEILQSYDLSAQEQQNMVADILATSARIIKLSEDMTDMVVAEVRSLPLETAPGSIRDVVEHVARVNRVLAGPKNIKIQVALPATLPTLEMDTPRIEEVLDNLVSNAIKYSRAGSTVTVEVKASVSHITVEVTDTGVGVSQSELQHAFEFGRKLSSHPTAGESSSGLGLWIVRKIVEAHHGVIWVKSTPGKGSTFSIMLPTRQPVGAAA